MTTTMARGGTGQGEDGGSSLGKAVDGEGAEEVAAAFRWWVWLRWSPLRSWSPCGARAKRGGEGWPNRGE
jgi:hypothetical protein